MSFDLARPIPSLQARYSAAPDGVIYSTWPDGSPRQMTPTRLGDGYLRVKVRCADGKPRMCAVHRLVAEAFHSNPDGKPVVNHKNGQKLDCRAENLEWVTHKENTAHAVVTGLHRPATSRDQHRVAAAQQMRMDGKKFREIAAALCCSISTAHEYVKGA